MACEGSFLSRGTWEKSLVSAISCGKSSKRHIGDIPEEGSGWEKEKEEGMEQEAVCDVRFHWCKIRSPFPLPSKHSSDEIIKPSNLRFLHAREI